MDDATRAASGKKRDGDLEMRQSLPILGLLSTLSGFHDEFGDPRLLEDFGATRRGGMVFREWEQDVVI